MDGGQVWPPEPESGTDYAGARGGRFRKFLKGSVGKLRVLPAGTRSGVGTRHGLRGAPPQDMGRRRHAARARGTPPSGTWGDVGTRHGLRGAPQPRAAERHCHEERAAGSTPRSWGDVGTGHGLRGAPPGHGEPPQDAKRRQHGARAAGSPPPPPGCGAASASARAQASALTLGTGTGDGSPRTPARPLLPRRKREYLSSPAAGKDEPGR